MGRVFADLATFLGLGKNFDFVLKLQIFFYFNALHIITVSKNDNFGTISENINLGAFFIVNFLVFEIVLAIILPTSKRPKLPKTTFLWSKGQLFGSFFNVLQNFHQIIQSHWDCQLNILA